MVFKIAGAILVIMLAWCIIYNLAPIGYEDENGWHPGNPSEDE